MSLTVPIDFKKWVEENRHLLKPPVGNREVYPGGDMIIMVVGGPNSRKDYHYNESPEFFYQVEGDITVKVIDEGIQKDINIKEGEMFLLPSKMPHSPQRGPGTIGLVVEVKRPDEATDALEWYCENCSNKLYREEFKLKDIVAELPRIMGGFYSDEKLRTCSECGYVMEPPKPASGS